MALRRRLHADGRTADQRRYAAGRDAGHDRHHPHQQRHGERADGTQRHAQRGVNEYRAAAERRRDRLHRGYPGEPGAHHGRYAVPHRPRYEQRRADAGNERPGAHRHHADHGRDLAHPLRRHADAGCRPADHAGHAAGERRGHPRQRLDARRVSAQPGNADGHDRRHADLNRLADEPGPGGYHRTDAG